MLKVDKLNKTFHTAAGDVHAVRDVTFNARVIALEPRRYRCIEQAESNSERQRRSS